MIRIVLYIIVVFELLFSVSLKAQKSALGNESSFVAGVIIVKLKPSKAAFFKQGAKSNFEVFEKVLTINSTFPNYVTLNNKANLNSKKWIDLSLIYTLTVNSNEKYQSVIRALNQTQVFEYVEQKKLNYVAFTPNDPEFNKQSYLTQINALAAWDITQGSTSVKIGIVDTGTDMDHPDLQSEMAENAGDPVNGIDDDNDGYVDNFNGWDFIDNDEVPQVGTNTHGIHVAGIAAAATHNNQGVASVGYQTQFMPVRVGDGRAIVYGYEGIVYAADMGCDIINCSWGSFGYSAFEEDIINYATFNKNALVVCAAGNNGQNQAYYPAAYENTLAVSSVNSTDIKSSFSNYGYWVDIAAPGENVYSCVNDGNYNYNTGTSMAAPVVSGAAALVKAVYPQLTAKQIIERLRNTSTGIDGLNPTFANKLGKGRLNVGNAVTGSITKASVVFGNTIITNLTDNVFKAGDSLHISGTFTNYLSSSQNVVATISTTSPYIINNHTAENFGVMASLVQMDNYSFPYSFKIALATPINTEVVFKIQITDGIFTNNYFVKVLVNVDYLNISVNEMATTIGSVGQFGYNARNQNQGLGVTYKNGTSQLFEGGLMIGTDDNALVRVVDRVRKSGNSWDSDFASVEKIRKINPTPEGDYYIQGSFNDSPAAADSIGLLVLQSMYASTDVGHENYIVMQYDVINTNAVEIKNVSIGLFADFDVANYDKNVCYTDLKRFYTFTQSTETGYPVFGVQLLTMSNFRSYCLDNISGGNGGVDILNGYTGAKKYTTLTSNRYGSGFKDVSGNDVIQVTATGGFDIQPNDTVKVAFALMAAEYKGLLDQVADSAYMRYNGLLPNSVSEILVSEMTVGVYPNPANSEVTVGLSGAKSQSEWSLRVIDVAGRVVFTQESIILHSVKIDLRNLMDGMYFIEIQSENKRVETKFIKNSF